MRDILPVCETLLLMGSGVSGSTPQVAMGQMGVTNTEASENNLSTTRKTRGWPTINRICDGSEMDGNLGVQPLMLPGSKQHGSKHRKQIVQLQQLAKGPYLRLICIYKTKRSFPKQNCMQNLHEKCQIRVRMAQKRHSNKAPNS